MGFSLLELLIVTAISSVVLTAILNVFNIQQQHYRYSLALTHFSTTGLTLSNLFDSEIKTAGYVGCAKLTANLKINNTLSSEDILLTPGNSLIGYSSSTVTADLIGSHRPFAPNSDVLMIRKMAIDHNAVLSDMMDNTHVTITATPHYKPADIIIVSDCRGFTIARIKTVSSSKSKNTQTLELTHSIARYKAGAELGLFQQLSFYVATTTRKTPRGDPIYALYMNDIQGKSYELLENIDNFLLRYFEIKNHTTVELSQNAVRDWSSIKSIHASFLIESPYYVDTRNHRYFYNNVWETSPQGILKRTWDVYATKAI